MSSQPIKTAGIGDCPLVLGECMQGWLPDKGHFLITSPIDVFSWAEFQVDLELGEVTVDPPTRTKSQQAVIRYLEHAGHPLSGALKVRTPMEPGIGFGTSTADISASIRAAAAAWGETAPPEIIARIAIDIEPTDGSMYPGSVAFNHREGKLLEYLGALPPFHALAVNELYGVDTLAFDAYRRDFVYSQEDQEELRKAWDMVRFAVVHQDFATMADASTISARINEQLLRKEYFEQLYEYMQLTGAEGLMAAHSGSTLALLFDPLAPGFRKKVRKAVGLLEGYALEWTEVSNSQVRLESRWHPWASAPDSSKTEIRTGPTEST